MPPSAAARCTANPSALARVPDLLTATIVVCVRRRDEAIELRIFPVMAIEDPPRRQEALLIELRRVFGYASRLRWLGPMSTKILWPNSYTLRLFNNDRPSRHSATFLNCSFSKIIKFY
jgi:hypothetical protein